MSSRIEDEDLWTISYFFYLWFSIFLGLRGLRDAKSAARVMSAYVAFIYSSGHENRL